MPTSCSRLLDKFKTDSESSEQNKPSGVEIRLLSDRSRFRSSFNPARESSVSVRAMAGQSVLCVRTESVRSSVRAASDPDWISLTLHQAMDSERIRGIRTRISRSSADSKNSTSLHSIFSDWATSGCATDSICIRHSPDCSVRS